MDESKNPPSQDKVGDASNSIADKQLGEAIYTILRYPNNKLPDKDIRVERSIRHEIRQEQTDQLLALFHTYGNRERLDELKNLPKDVHAIHGSHANICVPVQAVRSRIKELNREVES